MVHSKYSKNVRKILVFGFGILLLLAVSGYLYLKYSKSKIQEKSQPLQSNVGKDLSIDQLIHPAYTDSYPTPNVPYEKIVSSDGRWQAYVEYSDDTWKPVIMYVLAGENKFQFDRAIPVSFSPDSKFLLVYSESENFIPALFSFSLEPPYSKRQLTNLSITMPAEGKWPPKDFIPVPIDQNIEWSGHKATYSIPGEGTFTVDLDAIMENSAK